LRDEEEANRAALEVDLTLPDALAEAEALDEVRCTPLFTPLDCADESPFCSQFEAISLSAELAQSFEQFAPVEEGPRVAWRVVRRACLLIVSSLLFADESKLRSYALRPSGALDAEFKTFHDWRVRKLNRFRQGSAVQDTTVRRPSGRIHMRLVHND
jgi:hypothetical protein